jgi:uncharacterized membrane protein YccC
MPEKIEALLTEIAAALNRIADTQQEQLKILREQAKAATEARQQSAGAADLIKNVMDMLKSSKGADHGK